MLENAEWTTPLVADYSNYQTYYAGFQNVVKSTDNGFTWMPISSFPPPPNFYGNELSALAVSKSDPDVIYAGRRVRYEYANPGAVFMTTNGGSTWTDVTNGLPDSLYYTSIEINPVNSAIAYISMAGFSSGNKIFKTTNNGATWNNISYNLPNIPVNCIRQIPGTAHLMLATDLGIYVLTDGSNNWVNQSFGLPNVIVSDIEFNPALNKIYISTFGRGIWATDLDLFTGIHENEFYSSEFQLFPTPCKGALTIQTSGKRQASIDIYNIHGKLIYTSVIQNGSANINLNVDAGLYFAKIRAGKRLEVKKFIVEK